MTKKTLKMNIASLYPFIPYIFLVVCASVLVILVKPSLSPLGDGTAYTENAAVEKPTFISHQPQNRLTSTLLSTFFLLIVLLGLVSTLLYDQMKNNEARQKNKES